MKAKKIFIRGISDLDERFSRLRESLMGHCFMFGKLTNEQEDEIYTKHGFSPPDRTPKREGNFFIATVDGNNKMLFKEPDGSVYDFTGHPSRENIDKEPFKGEWVYLRAVSGFDF